MSAVPHEPLLIRTNVRTFSFARMMTSAAQIIKRKAFGFFLRVAPRTAARTAARWFFTPIRGVPSERMTEFLATGQAFTLASSTGRIQGWSWGQGAPVYLVHGWSGRGGQLSAFVQPLVDRGYSVVTFDAPGHGLSEGAGSSLIAFAEVLRELVSKFGPAAGVVAHSLGGAAAAHAMRRGVAVPRLVLIGTPAEPARFFHGFVAHLGLSASLAEWIKRELEQRIGFVWSELSFAWMGPRLGTPLLVVHDRGDKEVPFQDGQAIADAWPGARLAATTGLGHRRILHDEGVVSQVVDFISRNETQDTKNANESTRSTDTPAKSRR
ncbi:MAG: alpha/beta hydrolase [Thermoanaerobaculia bacterium]